MKEAHIFICVILGSLVQGEFIADYMTSSCGKWLSSRISGRLEATTSLTYNNNMNCETTISVSENKLIRLVMKRFEVEAESDAGNCLDYLSVFDGISSSFPVMIDQMCGSFLGELVFNTTANHVTFKFVTDSSAVYRGFDVEYTAYSLPPCATGEFECGTGICIDEGNTCDIINQCGDYTDEAHCTDADKSAGGTSLDLPLVLGAGLGGLALLIILIIISVKLYYYIKWKMFMKKHDHWTMEDLYEYPVTDRYNKHNIGHKGRRVPREVTFYDNPLSYSDKDVKEGTDEM